ncbi:MAG: hypothetical protein AB1589_39290 [Cyanobacteriota bacterium]
MQLIEAKQSVKAKQLTEAEKLKYSFTAAMTEVAKQIPEAFNRDLIAATIPAIPHMTEAAIAQTNFIRDEDLIWSFIGLGRFYRGQGFYKRAEFWFKQCLFLT